MKIMGILIYLFLSTAQGLVHSLRNKPEAKYEFVNSDIYDSFDRFASEWGRKHGAVCREPDYDKPPY